MSGVFRGIKRVIHTLYEFQPGKWGIKVELECGHVAYSNVGLSKGHRNYRTAPKRVLCKECVHDGKHRRQEVGPGEA